MTESATRCAVLGEVRSRLLLAHELADLIPEIRVPTFPQRPRRVVEVGTPGSRNGIGGAIPSRILLGDMLAAVVPA